MGSRRLSGSIICLVFFLFLVSGCARQQPVQEETSALPVSTVKVKTGVLEAVNVVTGKLEALESSNVAPKIPGKVEAVHVDIGSPVKAGQVLVTLENKDLQDRVNQAQAAVKQGEAAVAAAQAGIQAAEAVLANAQTAFALASANYERGKELLAQGAIPPAVFEAEYELKYKQAKEQVERGAPAQLELARAQASQAAAGLEATQANLALARQAYEDSFIRAPFSGVVTARNINPGELASAAVPAVTIVNLDKLVVKAAVGEQFINQLKQGQKVSVKISAASEKPFTGVVTNFASAADPATKAFPVKIQLDNPVHVLKPGMFAEAQLASGGKENLLAPREAVVKIGNQDVVWAVENGTAKMKKVKVGESDGKQIAVLSGLKEGAEVVVSGQESLQDGIKVNVQRQEEK